MASAAEKEAAAQEHCPRCHEGLLYTVTDSDDRHGLKCFSCEYHESRVKDGYEVKAPGEPITKVESESKTKGGA